MAGRAAIDRRSTAAGDVVGNMLSDAVDAQIGHELPGVVTLVGTQSFLVGTTELTGHCVACGAVGLVGEQQAAEVTLGTLLANGKGSTKALVTAGWRRVVVEAVDPLQKAVGGPGQQQGAINREVLRTQQRPDFRCCQQQLKELGHELLIQEPVTVLVPPARSACGRCKGE